MRFNLADWPNRMIIEAMVSDTELIDGFLEDAEGAIARGALRQASGLYQGVLGLDPANLMALTQLAALAFAEEDYSTALSLYGMAVEQHSREADVHHGLGAVYWKLGDLEKAQQAFNTALRIEPGHEPALYDTARLLQTQGHLDQAEHLYLKLTSNNRSRVDAIFNRGVVMFRKGNLVAADRWFRQAAKRDPYAPRPVINLALIYRYWGRLEDAHRCLTHVIEHHPELAEAQWNLANLELLQGNLKDGFRRKEWRFKREGFAPPERDLPRWAGEDIAGKSLLLVAEQGLGDTLQMIRYASVLQAQGIHVGIEAQPSLMSLLATAPGVEDVISPGSDTSHFDVWLPIMSLPALLGTVQGTIPNDIPYVSVPASAAIDRPESKGLKVGIVWRGNPKHETDHLRSIPLSAWAPILETKGVEFVSLQVGHSDAEWSASPFTENIIDAAPQLTDFAATAAWVASLDLVIAVDTAVAHLAGAMGKPVWLLISPANDWRWMTARDDSPWYPTLRIFRAAKLGGWTDVMHQVAAALSERVSQEPTDRATGKIP